MSRHDGEAPTQVEVAYDVYDGRSFRIFRYADGTAEMKHRAGYRADDAGWSDAIELTVELPAVSE